MKSKTGYELFKADVCKWARAVGEGLAVFFKVLFGGVAIAACGGAVVYAMWTFGDALEKGIKAHDQVGSLTFQVAGLRDQLGELHKPEVDVDGKWVRFSSIGPKKRIEDLEAQVSELRARIAELERNGSLSFEDLYVTNDTSGWATNVTFGWVTNVDIIK